MVMDVVLIGCSEGVAFQAREELTRLGALVEAAFPNARAAAAGLNSLEDRPRQFIVHLRAPQGLEQVEQLRSAFPGRPVLGLVEAGLDPTFLFAAMRAGAAQLVQLPLKVPDFKAALDCIAAQFGPPVQAARVIAVSGVAGGCGATTLAINLAYEIAHLQAQPCVLMELSLRLGSVAAALDLEPRFTTADLLENVARVDDDLIRQVLTPVKEHFAVLSGAYRKIAGRTVDLADVLRVIDHVKRLTRVLVLDVPCTYDAFHFKELAAADQVVLVAEQTVASIRALKMVREILGGLKGVREEVIVLNRYNPKTTGFGLGQLETVLGASGILSVRGDPSITEAVNHGRPLRLENPRSGALADLDALAGRLVKLQDEPQTKPESPAMFRRLVRAFGMA